MRQSAVRQVTASTEVPGNLIYWASGMRQQGRPAEASTVLYQVGIDDEYLDVYGHELIGGRNLRSTAADSQLPPNSLIGGLASRISGSPSGRSLKKPSPSAFLSVRAGGGARGCPGAGGGGGGGA